MRTDMKLLNAKPAFRPIQLTITLETHEEARAFRHMVGCWNAQAVCSHPDEARALARDLQQRFPDLPVF